MQRSTTIITGEIHIIRKLDWVILILGILKIPMVYIVGPGDLQGDFIPQTSWFSKYDVSHARDTPLSVLAPNPQDRNTIVGKSVIL